MGLTLKMVQKVPLVQSACLSESCWVHIAPILKTFHSLPNCFGVQFKVLVLIFKCLLDLRPAYLKVYICLCVPVWQLHLSSRAY